MRTWSERQYIEMTEAELKRSVRERIIKARTDGIPTGRIIKYSNGGISFDIIYGMIGAVQTPIELWQEMDRVLRKMGYE